MTIRRASRARPPARQPRSSRATPHPASLRGVRASRPPVSSVGLDDPARLGRAIDAQLSARFLAAVGVGVVVIVATAAPAACTRTRRTEPDELRDAGRRDASRSPRRRRCDPPISARNSNSRRARPVRSSSSGTTASRISESTGAARSRTVRSPARYLNRTTDASTPVPDSADPEAAPDWRRTGDGSTLHWHDHRAHWMGAADPPIVQRDPGSEHVVQRWRIDAHGRRRVGTRHR